MAIGTNPSAGSLFGTTNVAAVAGVATFSALKIDKAGTGYTLAASATGPTGATSASFDITVGVATKLVVLGAAGEYRRRRGDHSRGRGHGTGCRGEYGADVRRQRERRDHVRDRDERSARCGGPLRSGRRAVWPVSTTLSIDKSGNGYKLTATSSGLTSVTSGTFNITVGPAVKLGFTVQPPATVTAGANMSADDSRGGAGLARQYRHDLHQQHPDRDRDESFGRRAYGDDECQGVLRRVFLFDLEGQSDGVGYTLVATTAGLLDATSTPFTVNPGSATQLAFTTQPLSTRKGTVMPAVRVSALDAQGNVATSFTSNITVAIGTNPNFGTLGGTTW